MTCTTITTTHTLSPYDCDRVMLTPGIFSQRVYGNEQGTQDIVHLYKYGSYYELDDEDEDDDDDDDVRILCISAEGRVEEKTIGRDDNKM